jgi:hypothetical protein
MEPHAFAKNNLKPTEGSTEMLKMYFFAEKFEENETVF